MVQGVTDEMTVRHWPATQLKFVYTVALVLCCLKFELPEKLAQYGDRKRHEAWGLENKEVSSL